MQPSDVSAATAVPSSGNKSLTPATTAGGRAAPRPRRGAAPPAPPTAGLTLANHPLSRRHYRVATAAIQEFVDLVELCVRVRIPGALIHARPRMGKTHAIEYLSLHLGRQRPDLLVLRLSCEHHRSAYEGPFFSALLAAAGVRDPQPVSNAQKRFALMRAIRGRCSSRRCTRPPDWFDG